MLQIMIPSCYERSALFEKKLFFRADDVMNRYSFFGVAGIFFKKTLGVL